MDGDNSNADAAATSPVPKTAPSSTPTSPTKIHKDGDKVEILLKPVGDAPALKQKKWSVDGVKTIGWIQTFLRKMIKLTNDESMFIYVQQSFAPSPDQTIANLYSCFGSDGKLVLHYSKTQAWG